MIHRLWDLSILSHAGGWCCQINSKWSSRTDGNNAVRHRTHTKNFKKHLRHCSHSFFPENFSPKLLFCLFSKRFFGSPKFWARTPKSQAIRRQIAEEQLNADPISRMLYKWIKTAHNLLAAIVWLIKMTKTFQESWITQWIKTANCPAVDRLGEFLEPDSCVQICRSLLLGELRLEAF